MNIKNLNILIIFISVYQLSFGQSKFIPDSTVNSILALRSPKTIEKFSSRVLDSLPVNEFASSFLYEEQPFVLFINSNRTEFLMAIIHEGTYKLYFSEFKIGYLCYDSLINSDIKYIQTPYTSFYTESGLKLGIKIDNVMDVKGSSATYTNDNLCYCYNSIDSEFVIYGECEYFLRCIIKNDIVVKIEYGYTSL